MRLRLLGAFALECGDRAVDLPMSAQRLLAFLALQRRPVLRVFAAGSLWLDAAEDRAGACLRSVLWRLQLPDRRLVDVSNNHLGLAPGVEVDLARSLDVAHRVLASSTDPLALGSAQDDLSIDLLPYWYEDWVLVERERFRQLRLHALESLCEQLTACGRFDLAVEAGIAAVAGEPLRESAHRALIKVHLAEGNFSEALRQYRSYRDLLQHELGIQPSALMEDMMRGIRPRGSERLVRASAS